MEYKILNRVSKSKIKTIDFNDLITIYNYEIIDLKDWLKNDLILIESDFRKKLQNYKFKNLKDKYVLIQCSNNAIIPHINKTKGKTNWTDYYSKDSLKKIREICSEDFEFFNYDKTF